MYNVFIHDRLHINATRAICRKLNKKSAGMYKNIYFGNDNIEIKQDIFNLSMHKRVDLISPFYTRKENSILYPPIYV